MLAGLYVLPVSGAQEKPAVRAFSGSSVVSEFDSFIGDDALGADDVKVVHKALSAFYLSTNGDQWTNNSGWDINVIPSSMEDFNQWYGLTVSDQSLVTISLENNRVSGSLPSELENLVSLQSLELGRNFITGPIPAELGNLSDLESLSLGMNQLSGQLPRSLLQLTLEGFDFRGNSGLCAPSDDEFQSWLGGIDYIYADPNCTSAVLTEQEGPLPIEFMARGNYPNPVRTSTTLRFDLPWTASVSVEVLDVTGRRVSLRSPVKVSAGWGRELSLRNLPLPQGIYLYRLMVDAPEGIFTHAGRFVRVHS